MRTLCVIAIMFFAGLCSANPGMYPVPMVYSSAPAGAAISYTTFVSGDDADFRVDSGNIYTPGDGSLHGPGYTSSYAFAAARNNTDLGSPNHYVSATISGADTSSTDYAGIACRYTDTNNLVEIYQGNNDDYSLRKVVSGSVTWLAGTSTGINGTWRIECSGNTAELFYNGVSQGSGDISDVPTSNYIGVIFNAGNGGSDTLIDSLEADQL